MRKLFIASASLVLLAAACTKAPNTTQQTNTGSTEEKVPMTITSPAFENNGTIPDLYSCEGQSVNPPLKFSGIPEGAKSLAMLMDDPDVPKNLKPDGVFDHWTVFNMPPDTTNIQENTKAPGVTGKNGAGQSQYTGPCPPDREHRYFFKLYALDIEKLGTPGDTKVLLSETATKADVLKAMEGHVIGQAELVGKYNKKANR